MATQQRSSRTSPAKKTTDRQRFEHAVEIAERLAERNAELERKQSAAAAGERQRREIMGGLPPITDKASMEARYQRLAKLVGEPTFAEPGKFGGMSESEQKRVNEARRRLNLKSKDAQ